MCAKNFKRVNPAAKFRPALLHFVTNVTAGHGLDVRQFLWCIQIWLVALGCRPEIILFFFD